jgi:hypothetical protein
MNQRIAELNKEVDEIEAELQKLTSDTDDYRKRHDQAERNRVIIDDIIQEQEGISKTLAEAHSRLAQYDAIEKLVPASADSGSILVAHPESSLDWVEVSDIELMFVLHKNAQIYKSTYDPEVSHGIQRFADEAMMQCGFRPLSVGSRSKDQIAQAAEYTVRRILSAASSESLIAVQEGLMTLDEILSDDLQEDIFVKGLQLSPIQLLPEVRKKLGQLHA